MTAPPFDLPDFQPGSVWLVGAGPGDPGLLTLLAIHALRSADIVVTDALVDPRILALADCPVESMGKRGGQASPKQGEINARIVELARSGKRVLRLKGGDPFVFGRGAEEAVGLVEAGVPFRIVPGISAGVGGLAYAGIPVTARDVNSAVAFVTGHGEDGEMPGFDWGALAKGAPVIVFYMAFRHLDQVVERLLAAGRRPDERVAVVSRAASPGQRVLESTIGTLRADVSDHAELEPPALLVVGDVVRYRARLDWWVP